MAPIRPPLKLARRGVKISIERWRQYKPAQRRELVKQSDKLAARNPDEKQTHTVIRRVLQTPAQQARNSRRRAARFAAKDAEQRKGVNRPKDEETPFWLVYRQLTGYNSG